MAAPANSAPAPAPRGPIITLRYNGAAPPPHPACTEPTPEEEFQHTMATREQALQQKDQARQQELATQEQKSGGSALFKVARLASSVASVVEKAAGDIQAKGEKSVRQMHAQKNQERFAANFPELVHAGEQLMCDYPCSVLSQGQEVEGNMQLTNRHLCFTSGTIREMIPLAEIASIQKSVSLPTVDNGPPFVMPIPAPHILFDTLQIFTVRQQVFQFLKFESTFAKAGQVLTSTLRGRAIDRAYNFIDHAWRAAVQVPLPNVSYAQY